LEIVHIIKRLQIDNNRTDYQYIGKYQQVLVDKKRMLSVFVKVKVHKEQKDFFWNDAFFATEDEARKKADELYKVATEQSQIL
jgi:hypothetical protein